MAEFSEIRNNNKDNNQAPFNLYSFFLDHSSYSISFNPNLIYHESAAFFPTNPSGVFCQPFLIQYMAVSGSGGPVHAATLH